jgi:hypothetical protein
VLSDIPLRQWVITFPQPLPRLLAWHPKLLAGILEDAVAALERHLRTKTRQPDGQPGIISFVQTFTGDLRLYLHLHILVPEGVWVRNDQHTSTLDFVEAGPPSPNDLQAVVQETFLRISKRVARWLSERDETPAPGTALDHLGSLGAERISAKGPKTERRPPRHRRWMAAFGGVEVEARVKIEAYDREGRERLIRYCARPGLSLGRLFLEEEDRVKIRFKNTWKNGTTGVVLRPEVFLLRLAGLMLPSGVNAVRYHRAFAPAFRDRERVVPAKREEADVKKASRWMRWATLMFRVFGRQPGLCPICQQEMTVVATLQGAGRAWEVLRWIERSGNLARDGPESSDRC